MKTKYQRMTKEEKKDVVEQYKKTEKGAYLLSKLKNVLIIGVFSYLYSIYMMITAENIWNYIGAGSLFIAGCVFVVASIRLRRKYINQFAVRSYKKSKKN